MIWKIRTTIYSWLNKRKPDRVYTDVIIIESMDDIPKNTGSKIFIVERCGKKRWAVFCCPNSSHRVEVNLMASKEPCWTIKIQRNKISLWPSVWVDQKDCHCHFWLRNNKAYSVDSQFIERHSTNRQI